MLKRAGLPQNLRLRHDFHFVEELANRETNVVGRMISIDRIDPNPNQPRYELGDITELVQSIKEKGVIEPLIVRSSAGRHQIISGERRYRAAIEAGLQEVPCIEREASDSEALELALVENLQRKDLTPFEEADGFHVLCDKFGHTHEEVARKIGKARTSVTETIRLSDIPERLREQCRRADIEARSVLLQIAKCASEEEMGTLIAEISRAEMTRDNVRAFRRDRKPPVKVSLFKFKADDGLFTCSIRLKQEGATKRELIDRLRDLLARLESEADS